MPRNTSQPLTPLHFEVNSTTSEVAFSNMVSRINFSCNARLDSKNEVAPTGVTEQEIG